VISPLALEIGRSRLKPHHMRLLELQLGAVLAGDDALIRVDIGGQAVEQRRLAGTGAARNDHIAAHPADDLRGSPAPSGVIEPNCTSWSSVSLSFLNLRMVSAVPSIASGGAITLTRLPSGRRASQIGLDSSTRRPTWLTIRWQTFRSWLGVAKLERSVCSTLPETSM
jgi:hypothetical protein